MRLRAHRRGPPVGRAKAVVALLHGYGADGADLIGLADWLGEAVPGAVFLSPDAPERCSVNPMGYQWFPISWIDGSPEAAMREGFRRAAEVVDAWLTETLAAEGVGPEAAVLTGFSQGAMMSLHVAPRRAEPLAGIVGFSGRYVEDAETGPILTRPPVLLTHGERDEVIPLQSMHDAAATLGAQGFEVRWHVSPGVGHGIGPDALGLAADFLAARLPTAARM